MQKKYESNKKERFSFSKLRNGKLQELQKILSNSFQHKESHRLREAPTLNPPINNGSMSGSDEKPKLMTRKQLLYPFDSDSEEEEIELTGRHNGNNQNKCN